MFGVGNGDMHFVKSRVFCNQFYSDLVTPMEDKIDVPGTTVHIFYALKMGEKYLLRYQRHFKTPDIRQHDMQHEELLVRDPEQWMAEVRRCCGMEGKDQ